MSFYLFQTKTGRLFTRPSWSTVMEVIEDIAELHDRFRQEYLDGLLLCGERENYMLVYYCGLIIPQVVYDPFILRKRQDQTNTFS